MFYTTEILSMRRKGKLARVWLAATLNERLFKQTVSYKALSSIRIEAICAEIQKWIVSQTIGENSRFSLYLSSQLVYGTVKLFSYQTAMFEAYIYKVQYHLRPVDFGHRKKRKEISDSRMDDAVLDIDLPEVPLSKDDFRNFHLQPDIHLLPEADLETIRLGRARAYVKSPTFGELTDEQVTLFLTEDDWQLHKLAPNFDTLNEPIRYGADEPSGHPVLPPLPMALPDFDTIGDLQLVQESTVIEHQVRALATPKKRESKMTNVDTPTKRRRRNLEAELDTVPLHPVPLDTVPLHPVPLDPVPVESIPLDPVPLDSIPLDPVPMDSIPLDPVPLEIAGKSTRLEEDNELHLESLELETVMRPKNRRKRMLFIDESTTLHRTDLTRQIENVLAHTVPKDSIIAVPVRRRIVPANSLLSIPSTSYRPDYENFSRNRFRYSRWAADLMPGFEIRTIGPFRAEDDDNRTAEEIRAADSRDQNMPEEISSGLGRGIAPELSSRNKTTEDHSAHTINAPLVSENTAEDYRMPTTDVNLGEITDEPILENTEDADTVSVTRGLQSEKNMTNVTQTSDPETGDIDAFLPPGLRARNIVKKTSHEKRSSAEAIIEIPESPASSRSDENIHENWSKPDLMGQLAVLWNSCAPTETVTLESLVPPETTTKVDAALCFTALLELHKDRLVNLTQAEPYGDIHIYKAVGSRHFRSNDFK